MSYVDKLRQARSQNLQAGLVPGGGVQGQPKPVRPGGFEETPIGAPTSANERPNPAAKRGASSAMLRQTIGDVFASAERLGIAPGLAAKLARMLEREVASMDRLHRVLEGANDNLFARTVSAASEGLSALDQASGAAALHQLIDVVAARAADVHRLGPDQVRAIELYASSIAKLKNADIGAELARMVTAVLGFAPAGRVDSGARAFFAAADGLLQSAAGEGKTQVMRAGLTVALEASHDLNRDAGALVQAVARGVQLTAGQLNLLTKLADQTRAYEAQRVQAQDQAAARLQAQKAAFEANPQLAPLADVKARVTATLSTAAQAVWFERMNANARAVQAPALQALAIVYAEVLRNDKNGLPPADALQTIDQSVAQLAQLPSFTKQTFVELANEYISGEPNPERLPGTLRSLATLAGELRQKNVDIRQDAVWAALARGLSGRDAFLQNNGPRAMLENALAQAPDDASRLLIARHGPRFAAVLKAAEAGAARDLLEQSFPADINLIARSKVDAAALAATYPTVSEDSLMRLAAIGIARGKPTDVWFTDLTDLYKNTRGNKEHQRSLRSLISFAERGGSDSTRLVDAFLKAKPSAQQLMRGVNALLHQNNLDVRPEHIERALGMLGRGEDIAETLEGEMRKAMVDKLRLNDLLRDAKVKVTDVGFKAVSGPLAQFFTLASNSPNIDKQLLKGMLVAVLEDNFAAFRFEMLSAEKQLAPLTPWARRAWEKSESMTHVRFQADGQKEFESRVRAGAKITGALFQRMTAAWGDLGALEKKQHELVTKLRELPKNNLEARRRLVGELAGVPAKIDALRWAKEMSQLAPETTTPLRFASMADKLPSLGRSLGEGMRAAIDELIWTVRIDDLAYSEVITHDGPDLATMYRLATTNCLAGWPHDVSLLAYCIDPNKRMIVTKNQAGEERRAMMRIVERQDPGHEGQPMLVLERTYPDRVSEEEKQRLVEHMLRRATEMGIPAAYPTEYYWDASKTQRGQGAGLIDMNRVIDDLNRRYHTKSEHLTIKVLNRAGNVATEYIDSAPLAGARDAGNVQMRKYQGRQDNAYENKFVILSPE